MAMDAFQQAAFEGYLAGYRKSAEEKYMGIAHTDFNPDDLAMVEIGGSIIEGRVYPSIYAPDDLAYFKATGDSYGIWIAGVALREPKPSPQDAWDALELGDVFDLDADDFTRVKVSNTRYVRLGGELLHAFTGDFLPIKREA